MLQMILVIIVIMIIIYIRKNLKNITKIEKQLWACSIIMIFYIIAIISSEGIIISDIKPQVWCVIILTVCGLTFLDLAIKLRNKYYAIEIKTDYEILKRNIDFEYNPSIIGFLLDHKLDLKELSSDILYLYVKKIVKIEKNKNGKYELTIGEKYNEYKEQLNSGDEYIIEYINNNFKFDFSKWKDRVLAEYESLGFFRNPKYISDKTYLTIMGTTILLAIFVVKAVCNISFSESLMYVSFLGFIIAYIIMMIYSKVRTRYLIPTLKGKEAIKKCIKLKKFMEEYTLLKDRAIEEIGIYEKYIPYAIALGVNKKYEGIIFEILGQDIYKIIEDIEMVEYGPDSLGL